MLRLQFGVDDLVRTRFTSPSVFCELAGSAQAVQQPGNNLRRWWRDNGVVAPRLSSLLFELVPSHGSLPGFLIPESEEGCFAATLDAVLSTPLSQIQTELADVHPSPARVRGLHDLWVGHRDALHRLGRAIHSYHQGMLASSLPVLHTVSEIELRRRAWQLAIGGIEDVLSTLHPLMRWRDGVLEVDFPVSADVELGGRGLRLCPSAAWARPGFAFHWQGQPCLVYPVPFPAENLHTDRTDPAASLVVLLGATRARILCELAGEHTTTSLAAAVGVSPGSASMHAAALRATGLVATRRDGRAVRHCLTDLGRQLVAVSATFNGRDAGSRSGFDMLPRASLE